MKATSRSANAAKTKKRISESASRLFASKGFGDVTVQEIVQKCGLTKGAFYHYFESKEDCLLYLHMNFVDYAFDQFNKIANQDASAEVVLRSLMLEMFYQIRDFRVEVLALLETSKLIAPEISARIEERKSEIRRLFENVVRRGQYEGSFDRSHDAHSVALAIYGMCIWAYNWFDPERSHSAEQIGQAFVDLVLKGLTRQNVDSGEGTGEKEVR